MAEFGLGAWLVDRGVLTKERLAEVLEAQVVYGGRLGTNLVELGILDLDQTAQHLAAMTGIPIPPKEWIESPDPKAIALLPKDLLAERGVLPLHLEGTRLHVALLDPESQPLLGALTRAAGRSIVPYVLPELRLRFALERHAGIPRPVRFHNVAKKLERVRREAAVEPDDRPEEVRLREALGIQPLAHNEDLIDESDFADMLIRLNTAREHASGGPASASEIAEEPEALEELTLDEAIDEPIEEMVQPADPVALETALAVATNRDEAARATIALARLHFDAAALLVVHRGMVMGLVGSGGELESRISAVLVPIDADSVFARAASKGEPYRGAAPAGSIDARVLRAIGRASAREMALLPISMRGRVVNLLYVDGGAQPLAETALGALSALTALVSRSYEQLIRARKTS